MKTCCYPSIGPAHKDISNEGSQHVLMKNVVTPHYNCLTKVAPVRSGNICFNGKIGKITPKLGALVAQWVKCWPTDLAIVSSSPA